MTRRPLFWEKGVFRRRGECGPVPTLRSRRGQPLPGAGLAVRTCHEPFWGDGHPGTCPQPESRGPKHGPAGGVGHQSPGQGRNPAGPCGGARGPAACGRHSRRPARTRVPAGGSGDSEGMLPDEGPRDAPADPQADRAPLPPTVTAELGGAGEEGGTAPAVSEPDAIVTEAGIVVGEADGDGLRYLSSLAVRPLRAGNSTKDVLFTDTLPIHDGDPENVIGELVISVEETARPSTAFLRVGSASGAESRAGSSQSLSMSSASILSASPLTRASCYFVNVTSAAKTGDNSHFRSTMTAYVLPQMLETLSASQHKMFMTADGPVEALLEISRDDDGRYLFTESVTGRPTSRKAYDKNAMAGFISEGADKILQRLLCRLQKTQSLQFLGHANGDVVRTVYNVRAGVEFRLQSGTVITGTEIKRAIHHCEPPRPARPPSPPAAAEGSAGPSVPGAVEIRPPAPSGRPAPPPSHWSAVYTTGGPEWPRCVYLSNAGSPLVFEITDLPKWGADETAPRVHFEAPGAAGPHRRLPPNTPAPQTRRRVHVHRGLLHALSDLETSTSRTM
ncbi:MAG: hypothetical protein BJ554DRAFT_1486 [Olpidium bornovanus]|uniref:Ciliogenesis-associated TTC17-interacting protein N-terminal domain-containing protein n=1 Tax=Olpidium bornovanus TaxID=278681 RepID=A0A8H8DLY1_9FUNG|nr:MAG: hypothetical protein BJ554DRAFT_1486 [Olpidium bornovanus]